MALKTYIWKGPPTMLELHDARGVELASIFAVNGQEVTFPEDHPRVSAWDAAGWLTETPRNATAETKPKKENADG